MEGKTAQAEGGFLPCLNSNISTEIASTQTRKAASALGWNVMSFSKKHGLENLGFLTLTFKDHVVCVKEAQRRLNSLLTHVIKTYCIRALNGYRRGVGCNSDFRESLLFSYLFINSLPIFVYCQLRQYQGNCNAAVRILFL